jgi:hypothetical protein
VPGDLSAGLFGWRPRAFFHPDPPADAVPAGLTDEPGSAG